MGGYTLVDLLAVLATTAILAGVAVPQLSTGIEHARTMSAARYVASRLAMARTQAVARSANAAVQFLADRDTFILTTYRDGNGNGVRTRDITSGADPLVSPPLRFADLFPQVTLFLSDPNAGARGDADMLMSFSPLGTATSGTLYFRGRDGTELAVRVLGATGRTRLLRRMTASGQWIEVP
jgi:type II secretory pathway pseudopilin PulG